MEALPILGFRDAETMRRVLAGDARRYTYSTVVTTVALAGSVQATVSIESDTDFVCKAFTARFFYDTGGDINRQVDYSQHPMPRIEIIDSASGASLFDRQDTLVPNVFGNSLHPFKLAQPHLFVARTAITAIVVNVATVAYRFQVAFHGFKKKRGTA